MSDMIDDLAEEFARRWRAGERPSVEDYVARHPALADEVRSVLGAVELLERHKPRPAARRVGGYRVVREIGRGGMGVVYEAEQEGLGRRVALKVLPGQLLDQEKSRARFLVEARAAARLHHTNIVPVFEVGESGGQCYYAMQLIRGQGLDRHLAAGQEVPPGWCRTVACVGAEVADALAYAHNQRVLHRDIKPSNLLLDERGAVWVTDFGVAKLVEEAALTQSGELVGTLRYMPPERFAGRSDERGDIYSLGVTLYEALTRRPAFPDTNPQYLIRLITEQALAPLRAVVPDVPADLETIVLKAAARDPDQRYQTATDLADDLRRFLDDRPIRARRAGPAEKLWRWCRRNPALATATATASLLMVAVTVVSVEGSRRTRAALAAETLQREQAEETSALALGALNRIYDRFAPTRLIVTPLTAGKDGVELPPRPALPPEAAPVLEELLRAYGQIARSAGAFERLRPQAAEATQRIGDIRHRLGRYEEAVAAYHDAIEQYAALPPEGEVPLKLARACNELGRALAALRRLDEAKESGRRALRTLDGAAEASRPEWRYELARSYYTVGQRDTTLPPRPPGLAGLFRIPPGLGEDDGPMRRAAGLLERLVADHPDVPEYRHLLACCRRDMPPSGPWRNANADRAVSLLRQLMRDFPGVPDYKFDLCETLLRLYPPGPLHRAGSPGRARIDEAITLSGELAAQYPGVPEYAAAHARYLDLLGFGLYEAGDARAAEPLHRQAIAIQARLVARHPEVVSYGFWLSLMERSLGRALAGRGELTEARGRIEAAIARLEALLSQDARLASARPFLKMFYHDLADTLRQAGAVGQREPEA